MAAPKKTTANLAKLREQIAAIKADSESLHAQPRSRQAVAALLERGLRASRDRGMGALTTSAALLAAGHAADPLAVRGAVGASGTFRVDLGAVAALALDDARIAALVRVATEGLPEGVDPEERALRLAENALMLDDLELAEEAEVMATGAARRPDVRPEIVLAA